MIPIWKADALNLGKAAEALSHGDLVAMPTETVYGLAGHALDIRALARIFVVKQRPFFDPLIVHVESMDQAGQMARAIPVKARVLMEKFWPGPLTLVLPRHSQVPDLATSGLDTVALRQPRHPVALALLKACGFPLAAPSANPFGGLSPTRPEHVSQAFQSGIRAVLDGGPCEIGVESTIVGFVNGEPRLLRLGGLTQEALSEAIGDFIPFSKTEGQATPSAPGQLPWHYAPVTPLQLIQKPTSFTERTGRGLLAYRGLESTRGYASVEVLSPSGDLEEAAARLFSCLHRLDAQGLTGIDAEAVPDQGLGRAILDRLAKASKRPANYFSPHA